MATYKWKRGSHCARMDAQAVGERLEKMRLRLGRSIRAADVVKAAKAKSSPMHDFFEWSDKAAATKHREQQARDILNSVVIVKTIRHKGEPTSQVEVRKYQHSSSREGYESRDVVLRHDQLRHEMVKGALQELKSWCERYADVEELEAMADVIIETLEDSNIEVAA